MNLLIYGDDTFKSRQFLNSQLDAIADRKKVERLRGDKLNRTELVQVLQSQSLFGSDKVIVIENLHSTKSKTFLKEAIGLINDSDTEVVLYEKKQLTPAQLKKFPNLTQRQFKVSPKIFAFLDSVGNKQGYNKQAFTDSVEQNSAEFVFFMLIRQIRTLLLATEGKTSGPAWKANDILKAAEYIGKDKLLNTYKELLEIDYRIKTGKSIHGMRGELELLLLTL